MLGWWISVFSDTDRQEPHLIASWECGVFSATLPSRARRADRKQRRLSQCVPNAGEARRPVAAGRQNLAGWSPACSRRAIRFYGNRRQ